MTDKTEFTLTHDIYTLIKGAKDSKKKMALMATAFEVPIEVIAKQYSEMAEACARAEGMAEMTTRLATYSIPKTVQKHAKDAAELGCKLIVSWEGEKATISILDPKAKRKGRKGNKKAIYRVDGKVLLKRDGGNYGSIKSWLREMAAKGDKGCQMALDASTDAHKADPSRWGPNTNLNAWQACQAFPEMAARVTRD